MRARTADAPGVCAHAFNFALAWLCVFVFACGGSEAADPEDSDALGTPVRGATQVDFDMTDLAAFPPALRNGDLLTVTATIHNTGSEASGSFLVRAFLKRGAQCDGATYLIGAQTMSIGAGEAAAFEVTGELSRVRDVGTHHVCLVLDALNEIQELTESNNTVGGDLVELQVVECVTNDQCDDANSCTDDICEPLVGCQYVANTLPCDDGFFCTVADVCGGGRCQGSAPRECVDPDLCDGTMYCDENADACVNGEAPPPCDDDDRCNGVETCNPADGTCQAGAPIACDLLLNNGGAPPLSSNVLSHTTYDEHSDEVVYLRDLGCPVFGEVDSFCPLGGSPTTLEVTGNGRVGDLRVFDDSSLELTGGTVVALSGAQGAFHDLAGGEVEHADTLATTHVRGGVHRFLHLQGEASIEGGRIDDLELDARVVGTEGAVRGGHVATLHSSTGSSVQGGRVSMLCARGDPGVIYGRDFDVTGGAYGLVPGSESFIHGVLESGELFDATIHQAGAVCVHPTEGVYTTAGSFLLLPPRSTFIANGLAFEAGDPRNQLDAADTATLHHDVHVRDTGCPAGWPEAFADGPCFLPGAATEAHVVDGAHIPGTLYALDDSWVTLRGGSVSNLRVAASARIEVWGFDFAVDGVPVEYGDLMAADGVLTGTLASGTPLVANFDRADLHTPGVYGTIELHPSAYVAAGSGSSGSLFASAGTPGRVEVELEVETGGALIGEYEYIELEDISQVVPSFLGLAVAAAGFQDRYQIWELDFTGELSESGPSIVRFTYDPTFVVPGQQLIVFAWDGSEWVRMRDGVWVDEENHTIEIEVESFSIFALIVREYMVPALSWLGLIALFAALVTTGGAMPRRANRCNGGRA